MAVLQAIAPKFDLTFAFETALIGGAAIDATGHPLPDETLQSCKNSDAVLLAAVGGEKWDSLPSHLRPEQALLGLRSGMELFANLRPAQILPQLIDASTLKREVVEGVDILVVRELTGGIYFGKPKGMYSSLMTNWYLTLPKLVLKLPKNVVVPLCLSINPMYWMCLNYGVSV